MQWYDPKTRTLHEFPKLLRAYSEDVRERGFRMKTIHCEEREYEVGNPGGQFQLWTWSEDITSKMHTPEAQEPMGVQMDEPIGFFGKDDASDMMAVSEKKNEAWWCE
jgi:hypothetical protein